MPAAVLALQIPNRYERERIHEIIKAESVNLSNEYAVSIVDSGSEDIWELLIKRPDGGKVSMQLHADLGDLTPAVIRIRIQKLIRSL